MKNINKYLSHLNEDSISEFEISSSVKKYATDAALDIPKKAGAIALSYLAYRVFNKFINKCHSACYLHKGSGTSLGEDKLCYLGCRVQGYQNLINLLQKSMVDCQRAKDPLKCKEDVEKRIEEMKKKLENTIEKRDQLKIALMRKGKDIEGAQRKKYEWE